MHLSDRAIGYISMLAIIGIIGLIALGMFRAHHKESHWAIVDFDELGSLQTEDVVVVRGYRVGVINQVKWLGDRARVVINFDEPLTIREGTQFNNVNYALMGQRRLEITLSPTGKVLPQGHIHQGHFEPGIAEALRLMENVNQQLASVRMMIRTITKGDRKHPSAQKIYEKVMGTLEGIITNSENTLNALNPKLNQLFDQTNVASEYLINLTGQADSAVKYVTAVTNEKIQKANEIIYALNQGTEKASQVITEIENSPSMNELLTTKQAVDQLVNIIEKFNALVAAIDTKGIKMYDENGKPVKLFTWKKTNLVGKTARQKAKERAEKGERLPD